MSEYCDICNSQGKNTPAKYDAKLTASFGGSWGFVCEKHFKTASVCGVQNIKPKIGLATILKD